MATKKSDLYVFTKAKELTKYIITVTEKSPKKYRFTLVTKLQNLCLDAIDEKRIKSKGSQKSDKEVSVQGNLFE